MSSPVTESFLREFHLLPFPSAGRNSFELELEKGLTLHTLRRANYEVYKNYKRGEKINFLPVRMDIETLSRCNFRCGMCAVSSWEGGKRSEDMELSKLKKILENQHGLTEVKLTGLGEPMLQGDEYYGFINYFRQQNIWVRMITNASLLHLNDNVDKLADSDVNDVNISIDGATKDVFQTIRKGSNFDQVCKNAKALNLAFSRRNLSPTKAWCCLQELNILQIKEIIELTYELGFPQVTFSLNLHGWGGEELSKINNAKVINNADTINTDRVIELRDYGNSIGIKVTFWDVASKYSRSSNSSLCPWPFERLYLSSDYRIVPCCMIGNPDNFEISSDLLGKQSLHEVWLGNDYESFRDSHLNGEIPNVCKSCY